MASGTRVRDWATVDYYALLGVQPTPDADAGQRARFVPVAASRVDVNGAPFVSFETRDGRRIQVREPHQHGDPNGLGPTVNIRYDPGAPEHVIVDSGTAGRDITFSIVAL